jgi:flagellar hook-length control protein FliK
VKKMALSIFDLKAGLKTDTTMKASKQANVLNKADDFRKVLEHMQQLKKPEYVGQADKALKTDSNISELSEETNTETVAQSKESDVVQNVEDVKKEVSEIDEQEIPLVLVESVDVKESETQVVLEETELVIAVPMAIPQQQQAVKEFEHLVGQLQQHFNGTLPLDEAQLQMLLVKMMNFLKQNAEWMEVNPVMKSKPIGELMLVLNQMLSGAQEDVDGTLQKLISQIQKLETPNADESMRQTSQLKDGVKEGLVEATKPEVAPKQAESQTRSSDQTTVTVSTTKTTETTVVVNVVNQTVVQQSVTAKEPQAQTFTPQQLPQELQKMVKNFRFNRANGVSEARFALNPDNLGHINVKISVNNGHVVAQIYTDTAMAKETLDAQLLHLRAALQSSGLIVEKLEVFNNSLLSQQFHEQKRQQNSQQFNKQSKQKSVEFVQTDVELDEKLEDDGIQRVKMGATIDVTA